MPTIIPPGQIDCTSLPTLQSLEQSARQKGGLTPGSQADKVYTDLLPSIRKSLGNSGRTWWYNTAEDDYPPTEAFQRVDRDLRDKSMSDARLDDRPNRSDPNKDGLGQPFSIMCSALSRGLKAALPEHSDGTRKNLRVEPKVEYQYTPTSYTMSVTPEINFYTTQAGSENAPPTCQNHTVAPTVKVVGLWPESDEESGVDGSKDSAKWEWFLEEQPNTSAASVKGSCR
jgi:hypothetical protein